MSNEAAVKEIDLVHEYMTVGFRDGKTSLIVDDFYTPDAWVVGGDDYTWRGTQQLTELYDGIVGKYVWTMKREALTFLSDTSAIEFIIGKIEPHDDSETLIYKIQLSWQNTESGWKCVAQFFAFGTKF